MATSASTLQAQTRVATPIAESMRCAVAIQLSDNQAHCQTLRGLPSNLTSFPRRREPILIFRTSAEYIESPAISERGSLLGAMDTIVGWADKPSVLAAPTSSYHHEHKKHDGSLPLIGVNTFLPKEHAGDITTTIELMRSTEVEKGQLIANVEAFKANRNPFVTSPAGALPPLPAGAERAGVRGESIALPGSLSRLQQVARAQERSPS